MDQWGEPDATGDAVAMMSRGVVFLFVMVSMAVVSSGEVRASDFEITPIAGYTVGGNFEDSVTGTTLKVDDRSNYGIILDINQTPDSQIELYYSRQPTRLKADGGVFFGDPLFDLDIHYLHLGGTYGEDDGPVKPYVVGTLGVTLMAPDESNLDTETKFSLSLGGGAKWFLTDRIGFRLEGRGFGTFFGSDGAAFCVNGRCAIALEGDVLFQFTANAGVIIAF